LTSVSIFGCVFDREPSVLNVLTSSGTPLKNSAVSVSPACVSSLHIIFIGPLSLTLSLTNATPLLSVVAFVLGLGMGCAQPVTLMLIFSRAPEGRSGEALGMRVTINQITHIAVPVLYGTIGSAFGVPSVFVVNALILTGGGLLNRARTRT